MGRDDRVGGGAGGEYGGDAGLVEFVEVGVGDDATDDDGDVAAAFAELVDDERCEGHVSAREHR